MKNIKNTFKTKKNILNIYVTAGFPKLNDTVKIVEELAKNSVDMIEIGMPFSDPLADGPTIQHSSEIAIKNGITLEIIFKQIVEIRKTVDIPIILMEYYNQVLQYGSEAFFRKAKEVGVNGFIIPDLPLKTYKTAHKKLLNELSLAMVFLITPQTIDERIRLIDQESNGFLYVVSSFAITGNKEEIQQHQLDYFNRINKLSLKNNTLIGFGIHDKRSFDLACKNANGAIIGSAFIKALQSFTDLKIGIEHFIKSLKP